MSTAADELPEHLRRYRQALDVDSGDPDRDEVTNRRLMAAWRAWEAEREQWAADNGWTDRQLLGLVHPGWVAKGWADAPPTRRRESSLERARRVAEQRRRVTTGKTDTEGTRDEWAAHDAAAGMDNER